MNGRKGAGNFFKALGDRQLSKATSGKYLVDGETQAAEEDQNGNRLEGMTPRCKAAMQSPKPVCVYEYACAEVRDGQGDGG